jgi:hypothetical protein
MLFVYNWIVDSLLHRVSNLFAYRALIQALFSAGNTFLPPMLIILEV